MLCATCLFDATAWTDDDLLRTLDVFAPWWQQLAAGGPEDLLAPYADVIAALPRLVVDVDAVHRGWHAIALAGRVLHTAGLGATTNTGRVAQVSVSAGGVPKLPAPSARIVRAGADLRPGTRLQVGDALIEVTVDAVPCRKNGRWFTDGKFGRLKVNSRRYARVLSEGDVAPGDAVVVEPLAVPLQRPAAALASRA